MNDSKRTPMLQQYWDAKDSLDDGQLLFFRLGDFYEMFYDDAVTASKLLDLTLTQRGDIPMCGVPAHTIDNYIKKLLGLGHKIAVCDQTSPVQKGSLVQREIVECISPGTIYNSAYLDTPEYNFLLSLYCIQDLIYCAWIDVSTADLFVERKNYSIEAVKMLLQHINAREVLFPDSQEELLWINTLQKEHSSPFTRLRDWHFSSQDSYTMLKSLLRVETLAAYDFSPTSEELYAISALFNYVNVSNKRELAYLNSLTVLKHNNFLEIDASARFNLELFNSMREHKREYSLIAVLDQCHTAMGSRELSKYLSYPLISKQDIQMRQEKIKLLIEHGYLAKDITLKLSQINDIPRILSRVINQKAHAQDIASIRSSIAYALEIYQDIQRCFTTISNSDLLSMFSQNLVESIVLLYQYLQDSLVDHPPIHIGSTRVVQEGFDEKLDRLRDIHENHHKILKDYVDSEQANLDFTLKLKYNGAIGYYFELSPSQIALCPTHFILRQSLTKQKRYKTDTLIELEDEIFIAESTLFEYEEQIFERIREHVNTYIYELTSLSNIIAELDVYISLAKLASERNYVCPEIVEEDVILVKEGRHPVIETFMPQGSFISNDLTLQKDTQSFIMLTGPNMSGKSTYLRQNALIVILAQIGSFVPAREATIGIRDRVFCRVGASDNLVKGESTFLVEMGESAYILQHASPKSLVIMDEIGRGTSVSDGESIAQAIAEYFIEKQIFTLFATHYHNLTDLSYPHAKNFTLSIEQEKDNIIFTRHIREGAIKNSYGIEVAKIAGLQKTVLERARVLLSKRIQQDSLLRDSLISDSMSPEAKDLVKLENTHIQEDTHSVCVERYKAIIEKLCATDIHKLTPLQALILLDTIIHEARNI